MDLEFSCVCDFKSVTEGSFNMLKVTPLSLVLNILSLAFCMLIGICGQDHCPSIELISVITDSECFLSFVILECCFLYGLGNAICFICYATRYCCYI